jgi:Tfp pilus assembly protein PilV
MSVPGINTPPVSCDTKSRPALTVLADDRAFSIVEIIIAVFILLTVLTGILSLITAGDRMRAHGIRKSYAATLAFNEIERIRKQASYYETISDTTYEERVNGSDYRVTRTPVTPSENILTDMTVSTREIIITVAHVPDTSSLVVFRLLQGYQR